MTSAYAIKRFQGRDFTIYTATNGGLNRLGIAFASKVPRQKHAYEKWLEHEREHFLSKTTYLETKIQVFTKKELEDLGKDTSRHKRAMLKLVHDYSEDEHIGTGLPCSLNIANAYNTPDWIYIIDLDKELFTIDGSERPGYGKIYFHLWDLPQNQWFNVFQRHGFTSQYCSQAIGRIEYAERFGCKQLEVTTIRRSNNKRKDSTIRVRVKPLERAMGIDQMNALALFHGTNAETLHHWWTHIPNEGSNTFAFQEVAFAILSLAAGQFCLQRTNERIQREGDQAFYLDVAEPGSPRIISDLGAEFIVEGNDRGSSPPNKTIYWFQHVLIKLVSDESLKYNVEAAIAEIRNFARKDGKKNYLALLFSIRKAVLFEFHENTGTCTIRKSDIISIRDTMTANDRETLFTTNEKRSTVYPSFKILQDFFVVAPTRQLALSRDAIPFDVCAVIYDYLDPLTRNACGSVSPSMSLIHRRLLKISQGCSSLSHLRDSSSRIGMIPPGWNCMLGSILSNDDTAFVLTPGDFRKRRYPMAITGVAWTPIIGSWYRPSMIMPISISFMIQSGLSLSEDQIQTLDRWSLPPLKIKRRLRSAYQ